jgi:hypothetical protein
LCCISLPLIAVVEFLALEDVNPPMLAVAAPRLRTTPGDSAALPLPTGNLANGSLWIPALFIGNPSLASIAASFDAG